ncbi:MAG TPA: alpha/beta fold hydrolase [Longimicrobiaceae bacterium]|nr:alpha/beta fold hydrolase [Longimicrobiaceae bacterium]
MRTLSFAALLGAACAVTIACAPRTVAEPGPLPSPVATVDTGRVAVEGGTLYYEARGSGPAVVLLHGGGLDHTMWDPQVEALARSYRVIRFDARGHGRSTARMPPFDMTEDLRRVLDHLGVQRAHLVGLSMGGGAAFDFATAYPARTATLVLVSTSGPPPGVPVPPGSPPQLTVEAGRARLRALSMPRLLVVGQGDSRGVHDVADRVEAEVPEVVVVRIAQGEHLVNRDAPEEFNRVLLRFLEREEGRRDNE